MDSNRENLRLALWVAIAALVAAVVPIWPYGLYTLLRLLVTGVALFALYVLGTRDPKRTVGLVVVALLFNPLVPVHLSRLAWLPVDLGVAYWFWRIIDGSLSPNGGSTGKPSSDSDTTAV
jgi:Family of unknown function (DUF6804)